MTKKRFTFKDAKERIAELEQALLDEQARVKELLSRELTDGKFGRLEIVIAIVAAAIGFLIGKAI